MRKTILAVLTALVLSVPVAAGASVHSPARATSLPYCSASGSGPCGSTTGHGIGGTITAQPRTVGANQNVSIARNFSACGDGIVSGSNGCPFDSGSGMNSLYNGDEIVQVVIGSNSDCWAGQVSDTVVISPCSGPNATGVDFVLPQGGGAQSLTNVYVSNHFYEQTGRGLSYLLDNGGVGNHEKIETVTQFGGSSLWSH